MDGNAEAEAPPQQLGPPPACTAWHQQSETGVKWPCGTVEGGEEGSGGEGQGRRRSRGSKTPPRPRVRPRRRVGGAAVGPRGSAVRLIRRAIGPEPRVAGHVAACPPSPSCGWGASRHPPAAVAPRAAYWRRGRRRANRVAAATSVVARVGGAARGGEPGACAPRQVSPSPACATVCKGAEWGGGAAPLRALFEREGLCGGHVSALHMKNVAASRQ